MYLSASAITFLAESFVGLLSSSQTCIWPSPRLGAGVLLKSTNLKFSTAKRIGIVVPYVVWPSPGVMIFKVGVVLGVCANALLMERKAIITAVGKIRVKRFMFFKQESFYVTAPKRCQ